jgi:COP9 signalosome complex subunit 3
MDPASSTFTTNHHLLITLCLEARSYRAALAVLDNDILEFPPSLPVQSPHIIPSSMNRTSSAYITTSSGISGIINYQHHLEYHLYGGMIYMALGKWARALEFLSYVITAPSANSISLIMVEAYRKWLLVGLLHAGKVSVSPTSSMVPLLTVSKMLRLSPTVSASATRIYHASSRAYEGVCEIFQGGNIHKLQAEIEAGASIWAEVLPFSPSPRFN